MPSQGRLSLFCSTSPAIAHCSHRMSTSTPYRIIAVLFALGLFYVGTQVSIGGADSACEERISVHSLKDIDSYINRSLCPVARNMEAMVFYGISVGGSVLPYVVILLMAVSLFLTFYLRFINVRGLAYGVRLAMGKGEDTHAPGEISHFQALSAALSGTVGLGNIAGVAVAITAGGPGAAFWMIVVALFLAATKFTECSLGNKYRVAHEDGSFSGGAMYYLSRGLSERRGLAHFGIFLSVLFALFCIGGSLGAGNMFQANQAYQQLVASTGGEASIFYDYGWLVGLAFALLVGAVIIHGIRSIVHVTEILVPMMGVLYVLACITIIGVHADKIGSALLEIILSAFTPEAQYGGILGAMVWGIKRAAFSNEAGLGSSPTAYAAVRTGDSTSAGMISLLEPVVDTMVICLMTALVIVITGVHETSHGALQGVTLTSQAFATVIDWFPVILTIAITLFAFSTMITWSYYGLKAWTYLFGNTAVVSNGFKIIFCLFVIVGASANLEEIVRLSEATIFLMLIPNTIGLFILSSEVKRDMLTFQERYKKR